MHFGFIGVCRSFMHYIKAGSRDVRISFGNVEHISRNLIEITKRTPSVFARRPRSLIHLERWKAKEHWECSI